MKAHDRQRRVGFGLESSPTDASPEESCKKDPSDCRNPGCPSGFRVFFRTTASSALVVMSGGLP